MIKYFILIWLAFSINLFANEKDSAALEKRFEKAIEWIKKDSLFNAYMVANCPKDLTFFLKDSTMFPHIIRTDFLLLNQFSSKDDNIKKWRQYQIEANNSFQPRIIQTKSHRNSDADYLLILMEFKSMPTLNGFYVCSNKCDINKEILIYFIYNENNEVINSLSKVYFTE